jgi:hypothetical protein
MVKITAESIGDGGEERDIYFGNVQRGYRLSVDEERKRFWYQICYRGSVIYQHKKSFSNRRTAQIRAVEMLHWLEKRDWRL